MKASRWVALLVCLGASLGYAQESDGDTQSKLIALERIAKLQACEVKDLKTLDRMLDDAFVSVDPKGRVLTKLEVLAYVQSVNSLKFVVEGMVVRLHGDTAIVTGLYRMTGVERGKPFVKQGRFMDTWLNKNGQWVSIASLSVPGGH